MAVIINVRVVPRSSRSAIVGWLDGVLKIRVAAPPVDDAANKELIRLISRTLGLSRSKVEIVAGHTSRSKKVRIDGVGHDEVERLLNAKASA